MDPVKVNGSHHAAGQNGTSLNGKLPASPKGRVDVYEAVTERILEQLEKGTVPWQSPSIVRVGMPRNFHSGKFYTGINVFLLGSHEFQSPYFLTYLQAQEMGGQVRKGEKGFTVVKMGTWNRKLLDDQRPARPEPGEDGPLTEKRRFLKLYTVFNACQIDGIAFPEVPKCTTFTESAMAENARQIVTAMPDAPAIYEGRKAYPHYVPSADTVEMPERQTFRAEWRFYKTLFHELAHATGHEKRLNRKTLTDNRGMWAVGEERKIYCQEELVAEMTAAFLGAHSGIIEDGFDNSASYLKSWLDVLRVSDHKQWLVKAASEAQRAADYILGVKQATGDESGIKT